MCGYFIELTCARLSAGEEGKRVYRTGYSKCSVERLTDSIVVVDYIVPSLPKGQHAHDDHPYAS